MSTRDRIVAAAAEVFHAEGYEGTTTRNIARVAGVNEVTIFRYFGTKENLLDAALARNGASADAAPSLPTEPVDPYRELLTWSRAYGGHLRSARDKIRRSMGAMVDRPLLQARGAAYPLAAAAELRRYFGTLKKRGLIRADVNPVVVSSVLMSALFSDAMGREIMPACFPGTASSAPGAYVKFVLAAVAAVDLVPSSSNQRLRSKKRRPR